MIPLKYLSIKYPLKVDDPFGRLASDCVEDENKVLVSSPLGRLPGNNRWVGTVSRENQSFKIVRTNLGLGNSEPSRFQLIGNVNEGADGKVIEVAIGFRLQAVMRMISWIVAGLSIAILLGGDYLAMTLPILFTILQILFAKLDLINTEALIKEAFSESASRQKFQDPLQITG